MLHFNSQILLMKTGNTDDITDMIGITDNIL